MSLMKIKDLFHFEKGSLQSTKATPGEYDFITAAASWKSHSEFTHDCEALILLRLLQVLSAGLIMLMGNLSQVICALSLHRNTQRNIPLT